MDELKSAPERRGYEAVHAPGHVGIRALAEATIVSESAHYVNDTVQCESPLFRVRVDVKYVREGPVHTTLSDEEVSASH